MDKHFKYELLKLAWYKYAVGVAHVDRFLQQFSSAWKGPRDDTGLLDAGPPKAWAQKFIELQKQDNAKQGQFSLTNSGIVCYFDPDTGNLVMQGAKGSMEIRKVDLDALTGGINNGRPSDTLQPSNQEPQHAAYNHNSVLKERMERNLKTMENWARASSKAYPKGK